MPSSFSPPLLRVALGLLFLLLAAVVPVESSTGLAVRAVSSADISTFRGATLVKNGQPTSCEFGLIDNQSAFIAANCLDFKDGLVNLATKYEIYFDRAKGQGPGRATLIGDKIRVHPLYNPTSFANNIAVVEFNFPDQGSWINYISVNSLEWTSLVNVRRQLLSPGSNSWGSPVVQTQSVKNEADCYKASPLFKSNVRDMVCSVLSLSSPVSSRCSAPYGTLYGVSKNSMAVSAIYSHSVVYNSNMCTGGNTFHYFTMLSNYTRYASSVTGRRVYEYIENKSLYDTMWHTTSHHFQNAAAMNAPGTSQFGGDVYAIQRNLLFPQPQPQPQPQPNTPNPPQTQPKPSNPAPGTTNNNNNNNTPRPTPTNGEGGGGDNNNTPTTNIDDGGGGGDVGHATSISNPDDGFELKPIDTSNVTNEPTDAATLIDPADNSSQTNVVIISDSDSDDISFTDDGTGDNGTGGTGGNGTGGSGGNKPDNSGSSSKTKNTGASSSTTDDDDDDGQPGPSEEGTGMPKKTVIALAVALPILFLLLGIGLYFAYRHYKRRKADGEWKPGSSRLRNNMRVIMDEIPGTSDALNLPGPEDKADKPIVYQFSHPLEVESLNPRH